MKIKEMIDIIGIKGIPFIEKQPGRSEKNQLTVYGDANGVNYWKDATIWFLSIDENCKERVDKIKYDIKDKIKNLDCDERRLNKCLAIYELLNAINKFKHVNGKPKEEIYTGTISNYVDILDKYILENLDFEEINGMNNLQNMIKENKLYRQLYFFVDEVKSRKDEEHRGYKKEKSCYRFGNAKYYEELDKITILVYEDCVELVFGGKSYSYKLDEGKKITVEEKIIFALNSWDNEWKN